MVKDAQRFMLNTEDITHQKVDEEIIIVNLDNGNYYSLGKTGAGIWELLERNLSNSEILETCSQIYSGDISKIKKDVNRFISKLLKENLIMPIESKVVKDTKDKNIDIGRTKKTVFETPVLQKYSDMQEFLLVDPIHEVNIEGWPHVQPTEEES